MVDRTRAAHLIPGALAGDEAEPVEDLRATLARTSANRMAGMVVLPEIETDSATGPQPTRHQPGAVWETEKRNP
jgi:hypothetical protein